MSIANQIKLLQKLHELINEETTGSSKELAKTLDLSKASIFRYLGTLKFLGAQIAYSKQKRSYTYTKEFVFEIYSKDVAQLND